MMNGKSLAAIAITALGMFGLYSKIEYAGYVLTVGLVIALSLSDRE